MSIEILETTPDCSGYHTFPFATHSGYVIYEVYKRRNAWYWSEYDDYSGSHTGFENGPFETSSEAYRDALKQNGVSAFG